MTVTPVQTAKPPSVRALSDRTALNLGIWFTLIVCLAIIGLGGLLTGFEVVPNDLSDGFFYEWQLVSPNFWNAATAWIGFALHNLLIWGATWWAQERYSKYTGTLRPANYWALAINAVFIGLHYVQTTVFYDGIAQDLPGWTAQFTVIMMLFVIIAMENRRRGIFFGKKLNFRKEFYGWLRRYHGYAFSFAVIFTFWFHPMIPTLGHIFGFAHVILVMLQGSLMFTRAHLDRKWNFLLEIMVLPHAAFVALAQGTGIVYMFLFGFLTIFIVTQMHGLGLKPWLKYLFGAGYLLSILITYLLLRAPYQANEIIRVPAIEYLMVFVMYGLWWLGARLLGQFGGKAVKQKDWQEGELQAM